MRGVIEIASLVLLIAVNSQTVDVITSTETSFKVTYLLFLLYAGTHAMLITSIKRPKGPQRKMHTTSITIFVHSFQYSFTLRDQFCVSPRTNFLVGPNSSIRNFHLVPKTY